MFIKTIIRNFRSKKIFLILMYSYPELRNDKANFTNNSKQRQKRMTTQIPQKKQREKRMGQSKFYK